ncbi:hypothetical protein GPUN_1652 [Glaciecola punicea ACAM 611]|uniref:Uncharacterized protein n=1 Tax=Glaciecola punicea ACAM 611 TaxID=1121923 RepID=H5TBU2_9ALTE|nr:hypothetical protein GPUN_1652 [Glaciecola punicea ACAM 611]
MAARFSNPQYNEVITIFSDQNALEKMLVNHFIDLFVAA